MTAIDAGRLPNYTGVGIGAAILTGVMLMATAVSNTFDVTVEAAEDTTLDQLSCSGGSASTLVTNNGFTFTLDKAYTCGVYVDGTYWVVDDGDGVQITNMTPAPVAPSGLGYNPANNQDIDGGGRHGWVINMQGGDGANTSGDDRLCIGINYTRCVDRTAANYGTTATLNAGESMMKTDSIVVGDPNYGLTTGNSAPYFDGATVLTAVNVAPTCSYPLRPPYAKDAKPALCFDDEPTFTTKIAPFLKPNLSSGHPAGWDVAYALSLWKNLGIGTGEVNMVGCTSFQVINKCTNSESIVTLKGDAPTTHNSYGTGIAHTNAVSIILSLNQNGTDEDRWRLGMILTQIGIDTWGLGFYPADGGIRSGRKIMPLYAYWTTGEPQLLNKFAGEATNTWQEDGNIFRNPTTGTMLFGRNFPWGCGTGVQQNCDQQSSIGTAGINRDGGWCKFVGTGFYGGANGVAMPNIEQQIADNVACLGGYQTYTHQYMGQFAIIDVLGLRSEWNNPGYFEYHYRMTTAPWNSYCESWCSNFLRSAMAEYNLGP